jgi:hypothetical protein
MAKRGRSDRLTIEQRHAIIICRVVGFTGWSLEYIEALPLEWIGNLLSYEAETKDLSG